MEGILIMLLYLVIGFFKKRSDKMKRKEIESDPNWNTEKQSKQGFNFEKLLTNIVDDTNFDDEEKFDKNSSVLDEKEIFNNFNDSQSEEIENGFKKVKNDNLNENILKKEKLILKTKKTKTYSVKKSFLFKNPNSLKKAIIYKEIIDKPLSLR